MALYIDMHAIITKIFYVKNIYQQCATLFSTIHFLLESIIASNNSTFLNPFIHFSDHARIQNNRDQKTQEIIHNSYSPKKKQKKKNKLTISKNLAENFVPFFFLSHLFGAPISKFRQPKDLQTNPFLTPSTWGEQLQNNVTVNFSTELHLIVPPKYPEPIWIIS